MPQTKYDNKRWVSVPVTAGAKTYIYAFGTNIKPGESDTLGHIDLVTADGIVIGCNYPKPPRASLNDGSKIVSSYVANDKVATLKNAGWSIQANRRTSPFSPKKLVTPYAVTIKGVDYGWFMPKTTEVKLTSFISTMGINVMATPTDYTKAVYGASFPKPGKISILVNGAGDGDAVKVDRLSSFASPDVDTGAFTGVISATYKRGVNSLANYTGIGTPELDV